MTMTHLYLTVANVLWVVAGFVGIFYSRRALPAYLHNDRSARRLRGGDARVARSLARSGLRAEVTRTTIHLLRTAVGIWSLWTGALDSLICGGNGAFVDVAVLVVVWTTVAMMFNSVNASRSFEYRQREMAKMTRGGA